MKIKCQFHHTDVIKMYHATFDSSFRELKNGECVISYIIYKDELIQEQYVEKIPSGIIDNNNDGESFALLSLLTALSKMNIENVLIQGDSKSVIYSMYCKRKTRVKYIIECKQIVERHQFQYIKFKYRKRKYNKAADKLCRQIK